MKLQNRLIFKNIKLNKKITTVIIIGIILSTFLLTSVVTIVSSFQKSMLKYSIEMNGDYHYEFLNVPISEMNNIIDNPNIKETFCTQVLGKISLKDILNVDSSLEILGVTKEGLDKLGIELEEGRMPQNDNEIVISNKIKKYQSGQLKIGKQITLENNEEQISQNNDIKSYTIVGTINITDSQLEAKETNSSISNKFIAITYMDDKEFSINSNVNIYIKFKNLNKRIETIAQILDIDEHTLDELTVPNIAKTEEKIQKNETNKYIYIINNNLIMMETGETIDETSTMLYGVSGTILLIIIFTSVYCIRNSFDISIAEKIKQYGMLSSIGATKKQIYRSILKESFLLGVIAIPIGIILGLLFNYYFFKVIGKQFTESLLGKNLIFDTNIISIVLIIFFSSIVVYFSARKSAKKIAKLSPIEAIKNNQDIVIKSKKIKSSKLIKKIFGIGGEISYKNIKRNRKRYRTTVVSIIISVALFITAISFTKYALEVVEVYMEKGEYDILVNSRDYNKLEKITHDEEISQNRYELCRIDSINIIGIEECYTEDIKKIEKNPTISVVSLGDQEYKRYLSSIGLSYEETKDKAVLMDITMQSITEDGKTTYQEIDSLNYKEMDKIFFYKDETLKELEIAKVTKETPMVLPNGPYAYIIISDELMNEICKNSMCSLYIQAKDSLKLEKYIQDNHSDSYWSLINNTQLIKEQKALWIAINIFLYGFILITTLIGITNIFNTITTSMAIRQKEFAMLKSIGMTKKEFNRMIRLESLFYMLKSLVIGIFIGILFSYLVYLAFSINVELTYIFPISGIIISILAVGSLIISIMKYSLNKIDKKNIIETIRNDNI